MNTNPASSPADLSDPGATTVPNTPRPEDDPPHLADTNSAGLVSRDVEHDVVDVRSPSDDSHEQTADLKPTWPVTINVIDAPARVTWQQGGSSGDVFFNLYWSPLDQGGKAFFKIHTRVTLPKVTSARRDGGVRIFVFIPPERIRHLSFNTHPNERLLGPNTVAFSFDMIQPPALVLPKNVPAAQRTASDKLRSAFALAAQASFTVHASIAARQLSPASMQQFCAAVLARRLSSIERVGFASVPTLYQGHGGEVVDDVHLVDRDGPLHPPAYDDTSGDLPPPPDFPCEYCTCPATACTHMHTQLGAQNALAAVRRHPETGQWSRRPSRP